MIKFGAKPLRSQFALVLFSLILVTLFVLSCAEDPNPVGVKLLPSTDFIKLDTAVTTGLRSYNTTEFPTTSVSARVLVGNVNNLQCWAIVRFSLLPDSIIYLPMISAELDLRTIYHFGDSLAPISFTVHQILMNWGTDSLNIDSLKAPGFYNPVSSGSFAQGSLGDTASISIPLDTNMIRAWGTLSDSVESNFGVLLRPTNSNVVKGFGSFLVSDPAFGPKLLVRFRDAASHIDTLTMTLGLQRYVTTGLNPAWAADSTHVYVMNGGAERGYVEFNVGSIPPHAAVHKATLDLTLDAPRSQFNYFTADSLFAYFTNDDGTTNTSINTIGTPVQTGNTRIYRFLVGPFVQRWLRGAKVPRIVIAGYDESSAIDLFSFYGAQVPQGLKPKLTVIYSVLQ
jgi:hypothetical protein